MIYTFYVFMPRPISRFTCTPPPPGVGRRGMKRGARNRSPRYVRR